MKQDELQENIQSAPGTDQSAAGAGGLDIIRGNKVGESE